MLALDLPLVQTREDLRRPALRKTWTRAALVAAMPRLPMRVLDVGSGRHPLRLRPVDDVVTLDFDETSGATVVTDFTTNWPFPAGAFDLVYLSHVVEHLYPRDRDELIRNVYTTTKPGGFVLIRVPHRSSVQATGWEHHTVYGLNGAASLCHGYNPLLPMFRAVSTAISLSVDFDRQRGLGCRAVESLLSARARLTDQMLAKIIGGVPEVQFLLQRLPTAVEQRIRADTATGHAN